MIYLLSFILINTLSDQPNIRLPIKEIAKKTSVNQKVLESSKDRINLSPSKRSKYPINVKSWFKLIDENFESGMPSGWTVINGDNDAFTWVVGTYSWTPPPNYGASYCCYNDDAAGEYNISGDSIQTPAIGIPDSTTYLYLSYGYGHMVYENEFLEVQVRYHNGISWGDWQQLRIYDITTSGSDSITLDENNDSLQVMWLYRDDHTFYSWGYGSSFDNVLIKYFLPVENDAGMYAINSPVLDTTIGAFVQVNGTVKNYGTNTYSFETKVNIYDPNSLTAFTNTIQVNNLAPSDTLNIDFGSFQLTEGGIYTVEMFTYALDDTVSWNDSLTTTFNSFDCYWESLPSPGVRTHDHVVVYDSNNDLYFIIGGDSTGNQNNMDVCLEFDPKTNTWSTKQPMPTKRGRHRASYRNSYIHVMCGKDDWGNIITTHEVYDIENNSWTTKASAPIAVVRPGVVTWEDSLVYLIGGYDVGGNATTGVYYYDIVTNSWSTATSLPRGFHGGGVRIKGDSIFIVGGGDGSSAYSRILLGEINPIDPSSINWYWGNSLPLSSNYENGFAIKNNKAYMIGGHFMDGTNQVWEYDIQNQNWASIPNYPTSIICRGDFAERRNTPDSLGVVYCFMGDTTSYFSRDPTDECYRLVKVSFSGIEEEERPEKNSISLINTVYLKDEIIVNYNTSKICDLKLYMYDITGRQVLSYLKRNIAPGQHKIRLEENLKNGIYFIRIEAGSTIKNEKVVLIH